MKRPSAMADFQLRTWSHWVTKVGGNVHIGSLQPVPPTSCISLSNVQLLQNLKMLTFLYIFGRQITFVWYWSKFLKCKSPPRGAQKFVSSLLYQNKFWTHKGPKKTFSERAYLLTIAMKKWQEFSSCLLFLFSSSLHLEIPRRPFPYLLIGFFPSLDFLCLKDVLPCPLPLFNITVKSQHFQCPLPFS